MLTSKFNHILLLAKEKTNLDNQLSTVAACLGNKSFYLEEDHHQVNFKYEVYQKQPLDLVITLGGDGTIMKAARKFGPLNIRLIGINLGRVGFLTDFEMDTCWEELPKLINDHNSFIEKREIFSLTYDGDKSDIFVNDFVGSAIARKLEKFILKINDQFVYEQYADGIIISTPTGSTAYSLASGGAILQPDSKSLIVTPICPQALSNRPIVINNNSKIELLTPSGENQFFIDGLRSPSLSAPNKFIITKSNYYWSIIHSKQYNYYQNLRSKLNWTK